MHKSLSWHDPIWYAALAGGILLYFIFALLANQRVPVEFGLCSVHRAQRLAGMIVGVLGTSLSVVFVFLGVVYDFPAMMLFSLATMLLCPLVALLMTRTVSARRLDHTHVWLHVGAPFLESFPDTWRPDLPYYPDRAA